MRDLIRTMTRNARALALSSVLAICIATTALAEPLVVIVNPESGVTSMTRSEVASVFMARNRVLAPGVTALPLDARGDAEERQQFYVALVGKSVAEINAYWARLLFTGRASPPQQIDNADDVLATVAANKGAIGYVAKSQADSRVRIVLELDSH